MAALQAVSTTHYSKSSDGCPDQLIGAYLAGLSNPSPFARYICVLSTHNVSVAVTVCAGWDIAWH